MRRRIDVNLTEKEEQFLNWLADRDGVDFWEEMKCLFYLQLREEMELYLDEMEEQL